LVGTVVAPVLDPMGLALSRTSKPMAALIRKK